MRVVSLLRSTFVGSFAGAVLFLLGAPWWGVVIGGAFGFLLFTEGRLDGLTVTASEPTPTGGMFDHSDIDRMKFLQAAREGKLRPGGQNK